MAKEKILVIVGPTASGKSALAVQLAKRFNGEVISADSRQVYRGLDIGTGKITKREMKGVPHYLLDVVPPKKQFGAGDFMKHARSAIENLSRHGKLPIVVGGTGFYIDTLVGRITLPDVPPHPVLRARLARKSAEQLYSLLQKRDPLRAKTMSSPSERNNKTRLIRALEIVHTLGKTPIPTRTHPYDVLWLGIAPTDAKLRTRINTRLRERLGAGMIAEAQKLHLSGLSYKRMEELGLEYRSLARFLQKRITRTALEKELQSDIWRYARKQLGYWKRNKEIRWSEPQQTKAIEMRVRSWLKISHPRPKAS